MGPTWNELFMQVANLISFKSTCARKQVGAVLVHDNRIISIGYNGTPSGMEHCCDHFKDHDLSSPEFMEEHRIFSINNELHAEGNALAFAAKHGLETDECTMYVTLSPCTACAKLILSAGIKKVYYKERYDRETNGIDFLNKNGVLCEQI